MTAASKCCAELSLLLACCRWNFLAAPADRPTVGDVDWPRFVRLARFHRVHGLAWNALAEQAARLPEPVAMSLSTDARTIAANNLAIARECTELDAAFAGRGCRLLFLKGLTIAALSYRSPLLKMGWDIDILVDDGDLESAAAILAGRGFALILPKDPASLHDWHRRSKESVWARADGLHIELHTRLVDNKRLVPGLGIRSPSQQVEVVPGTGLRTLAADELFAYLCVHGASSAWFRLKWITDIAGMLSAATEAGIERLYQRSQQLGAHRAAGQALLLADALYGPFLGRPLRRLLERDAVTRALAGAVLRQLLRRDPTEPTETAFGTALIHLSQFGLAPGFSFMASELRRQAASVATRWLSPR